MSQAAEHDFCIEQGATFDPLLTLEDSAGNPIDITGWEFRMEIREEGPGSTLIIRLDNTTTPSTNRITITDATGGEFELFIDDSVTDTFTEAQFEDAQYDLEAVDSAGKVIRLLMGCVALSLQVTQ